MVHIFASPSTFALQKEKWSHWFWKNESKQVSEGENLSWACWTLPPPPFLMEKCCCKCFIWYFPQKCVLWSELRDANTISNTATSWQRTQSGLFLVWTSVTGDKSWFQISINYMGGNKHPIDGSISMNAFFPSGRILGCCHITYNQDLFYAACYFFSSCYAFRENAKGPLSPELSIPYNNSLDSFIFTWKNTTFFIQAIKTYFWSSCNCVRSWE